MPKIREKIIVFRGHPYRYPITETHLEQHGIKFIPTAADAYHTKASRSIGISSGHSNLSPSPTPQLQITRSQLKRKHYKGSQKINYIFRTARMEPYTISKNKFSITIGSKNHSTRTQKSNNTINTQRKVCITDTTTLPVTAQLKKSQPTLQTMDGRKSVTNNPVLPTTKEQATKRQSNEKTASCKKTSNKNRATLIRQSLVIQLPVTRSQSMAKKVKTSHNKSQSVVKNVNICSSVKLGSTKAPGLATRRLRERNRSAKSVYSMRSKRRIVKRSNLKVAQPTNEKPPVSNGPPSLKSSSAMENIIWLIKTVFSFLFG